MLGDESVRLTGLGPDGGVDIRGSSVVAQVKAQVAPVGASIIQQLCGVATVENKFGAVYGLAGFTPDARKFADKANVALFEFDLAGDAKPVNNSAILSRCS